MEITKTVQPGDMGSKQLFEQYGEKLICVRYRIDRNRQRRYKTIELIIEEKPLLSVKSLTMVWIKIGFDETTLRQQVKNAGAKWLVHEKAWEVSYEAAKRLGLKKRIIKRLQKGHGQI